MGGVNDYSVHPSLYKSVHTLHAVGGNAYACRHSEPAAAVLARMGLVFSLGYVLVCHKTDKMTIAVYNGKFLYLMLLENLGCLLKIGALTGGDHIFRGHHFVNGAFKVAFKTEVSIGDYAHELAVVVHNRNTPDVKLLHHCKGIGYSASALYGDRVVNHAVFSALHRMNLTSLLGYGHVLVNHTYASLAGNGNGKLSLCDGVHGRRHQRHIKLDVA